MISSKSKKLVERLETLTFQAMQNPRDPLFSSELAKLVKESKKLGGSTKVSWLNLVQERQ